MALFGGEYLHHDLFEMAAAYLFHVVQNHPLVDGNERTGLLAAMVFLDLNGVTIDEDSPDLLEVTLATAGGRVDRRTISGSLPSPRRTT